MSNQFQGANEAFMALLKTVATLRDPQYGCPWDKEQTAQSLLPYFLEEVQEYMMAVEQEEKTSMGEELGDVLFQVVLHAQIAYEQNIFTIKHLCETLNTKLIDRHPHVFLENSVPLNAEEIKTQWNKSKIQKAGMQKLLDAMKLPPIMSSHKIGIFSHTVGFDWENATQVLSKVDEELQEVKEAIQNKQTKNEIAEEIGDLLFSTIQLARHLDLSADYCLHLANQKFQQRFMELHSLVTKEQKDLLTLSLEEKEKLWNCAKLSVKKKKNDC